MRRLLRYLLAALALTLLTGQEVYHPPRPSGAAACTAANYAALPGGQPEGALCEALDTGEVWRYSAVAALWLPPEMAPAAMISDYDGSVLPTLATPAWTEYYGAEAAAVAGGILTITDDSASDCRIYSLTDSNFVSTNNIAVIVRQRLVSQDTSGGSGWESNVGLRPSSLEGGNFSIAKGAALSNTSNIQLWSTGNGAWLEECVYPLDNATWLTYMFTYDATTKNYSLYVLGDRMYESAYYKRFSTSYAGPANTVMFGTGGSSWEQRCVQQYDFIKIFIY